MKKKRVPIEGVLVDANCFILDKNYSELAVLIIKMFLSNYVTSNIGKTITIFLHLVTVIFRTLYAHCFTSVL